METINQRLYHDDYQLKIDSDDADHVVIDEYLLGKNLKMIKYC